jgi:hypothetical protein
MPNVKFVHLFRHPGEVVRSGMRRGWYNGHPSDRYRIEPGQHDPMRRLWGGGAPSRRFAGTGTPVIALRFDSGSP